MESETGHLAPALQVSLANLAVEFMEPGRHNLSDSDQTALPVTVVYARIGWIVDMVTVQ